MAKKISVSVEVDIIDFAQEVAERLTQDEAIQMIKTIDDAFADYDFTKRLAKHFAKIIKACDKEGA